MGTELSRSAVLKTYARWAPVYDVVFGSGFENARRMAVEASERVGGRILEVGVGTGISLPYYSRKSRVVGIDISEPMLKVARRRVIDERLDHVEQLEVMDAENLAFAESSFDVVVAQYVVTALPNPERALSEFLRVVKPGGEIIITTRVGAGHGLRGKVERMLMPITSRLGWRTEFAWSRYAQWLAGARGMELAERRLIPPLGHFSLVRFRKADVAAAA